MPRGADMDLKSIAQSEPYYLTTSFQECKLDVFWVVLLSNGLEIYQGGQIPSAEEPEPWIRLKSFCKTYDLKICAMALSNKQLDRSKQINIDNNLDGYFYSKKITKVLGLPLPDQYFVGVGGLRGDILSIYWFDPSNGSVNTETRKLDPNSQKNTIGLIS